MTPPAFDDDQRLLQTVEQFTVEQFIAHAGVETLYAIILPRAAWRDVRYLCTDREDPSLKSLGDEPRFNV